MHRDKIILAVVILNALTVFSSPASILDLLSWDESEAEKRDENSNGVAQRSCVCNGPACMCCVDFNMTFIDLGGPGCVHMKYNSLEEGLTVNVSYGDSLLHSEQVKGPDPKPTCMSLLANIAQVCARLSNFRPVQDHLKGCLQLEPMILDDIQTTFDIGCFTMGPDGMKLDNSTSFPIGVNKTKGDSEEFDEEELLATVNETAEQSLAFIGSWLGLFDKPQDNSTTLDATEASSRAGKSRLLLSKGLPQRRGYKLSLKDKTERLLSWESHGKYPEYDLNRILRLHQK